VVGEKKRHDTPDDVGALRAWGGGAKGHTFMKEAMRPVYPEDIESLNVPGVGEYGGRCVCVCVLNRQTSSNDRRWRIMRPAYMERWGAGVETQKYVRGEIGRWGRVPFNETYAPSLSTIYDGA